MEALSFGKLRSSWRRTESIKLIRCFRCALNRARSIIGPVLILGFLTAGCAFAQTAQVSGEVTDASGASVPKASVTAMNQDTGIIHPTESNNDGYYTLQLLEPGKYTITVKANGFKTQIRTGITLSVGAQQTLNFGMQVGEVSQDIRVTGAPPAVDLISPTISEVVDSGTVRELPLNGRDWTQLATLQPGVVSLAGLQPQVTPANTQRLNRGFETQLSISGTRPQQNNYRLDGISINDYANGGPGSVIGVALGTDAIQEFSVLTSNYTAEYGRTSGGVINAITRSGTNQFHGDVYEFLRNSALDAPNFFDNFNGNAKAPFRQNQFGASGGGPIRKDRTFVFGNYEGVRRALGVTNVDTVPSQDARNGIIHNSDGSTTTVAVDPMVKPFLDFWPLPNGPLLGTGNTGILTIATTSIASENFATARIDHNFSEKDSIFGSWQYDSAHLALPDALNNISLINNTGRDFVMIQENHVFSPELVNSVRAGYSRIDAQNPSSIAINPLAEDHSLEAVPGEFAPKIKVTGLTQMSGGINATSLTDYHWNSYQGYDDLFFTKGIHSLKFGVAVERMDDNRFQESQPAGQFSFSSLTNFLTNAPKSFTAHIPGSPNNGRGYRQTIFGAYVQDDVHWRPNLTFSLGLRYEMSTVPTEVHDQLATLRTPTDATIHLGNPFFSNPTYRNFEPRVGFAWDPFRTGKTSVRGGFGMFDVLPLDYEWALQELSAAPFSEIGNASNLPVGSFPGGALSGVGGNLEEMFVDPHPRRNYVMTWDLTIQRSITPDLTAMAAYVGSQGVHLPLRIGDINDVQPTLTSAGYLFPFPAGSGTVLNPNFGNLDNLTWVTSSSYNGLELQIAKKLSHGFQAQASYTWSKVIDGGSSSVVGDNFINSISSLFSFDPRLRRALADFNVAQNLVINYIWFLPAPKTATGVTAWLAGGWQLGGIFTVQTGLPFTPLIGGDPLGLNNNDPFAYPDRLTGPGCRSAVNPGNVEDYIKLNCFGLPTAPASFAASCTPFAAAPGTCSNLLGTSGRNVLIGPGLTNFDFSIVKNNYIRRISENFNVQFRAEFFNVFNHANFTSPINNSTLFDQTGEPVGGAGLIDSTSTPGREIQFGLKVSW
jgi:Carboxypeptidase regulatory-like domain/TonB dependent receptor/TonB-dependent Receptor Plug Domain